MEALEGIANSTLGPLFRTLEAYAWVGQASHVIQFPALDAQLAPVAASLGMGLPVIKYTISLFLAYPFAALLRALPNKNLKHFFSMMGGIFLVQWIFEADWIHSFISSFVTYLICLVAPRKYSASLVFLWAMGYMTGSHVYRMWVSYLSGIFDFTGTQMVLTMKLTSFAYNLYDGTYDEKKVFAAPETHGKDARVYAERKRFAIRKLPNLLEFFGYIFCFTCLLAGPAFEYNDYVQAIDGSAYDKTEKDGDEKKTKKQSPSSFFPAMKLLLIAVVMLVGHIVLSGKYPIKNVYDKEWLSEWGAHLPRYGYLLLALFAERLKYYFAWKVAEGASVLGGFGFEGYDQNNKIKGWRGVENIDIVQFETAPCVQTLSRAWNKRTQGWLERYTYNRCGKSLMITYFVSAFWHGLYPGFFIFFMSIPLMTNIERLVRAKINPLIVPEYDGRDLSTYPKTFVGTAYWLFCWFSTTVSINYLVQVFNMSSLERCMIALGAYHHAPHIFFFAIYILLEIFPSKSKKSGDSKKQA